MNIFDKFASFFSPSENDTTESNPSKQASLEGSDLTLYYTPPCPYCVTVLTYLKQEGLSVPMKNVFSSAQERQELIDIGGKSQVPCLLIDGKAMYESKDIIAWFQEKTKKS